ncbi:hypothetical protein LEMLEM_LOCUS5156, partial [Lemmus lemmus]
MKKCKVLGMGFGPVQSRRLESESQDSCQKSEPMKARESRWIRVVVT